MHFSDKFKNSIRVIKDSLNGMWMEEAETWHRTQFGNCKPSI